jgi:hypothetical protein
MNRRIRKKKIDAADRLLVEEFRLYAERPRPRNDPGAFEDTARILLSLHWS